MFRKCDPEKEITKSEKEITKLHHLFAFQWGFFPRYIKTKPVHLDFDLHFPKGQL